MFVNYLNSMTILLEDESEDKLELLEDRFIVEDSPAVLVLGLSNWLKNMIQSYNRLKVTFWLCIFP